MDNPKISIIIPVYNAVRYLDKCLKSVINQTYINLEIILVNDGSTDGSLDLCKTYARIDNRVFVIDKPNGGVSSARNSGLDIATGDFIGFIDSDDYIDHKMYEELIRAIQNNNADIAECGYCTTDMNYRIIESYQLKNTIVVGSYRCSRDYLASVNTTNFTVNKLFKRYLFNGLRFPNLAYSEDYTVNAKAFYRCNRKVTISGCYYYYLKNDESACNRPFTELKLDEINAGKDIFRFHQERYSDLCSFIALYITEHITWIYKELKSTEILNSKRYEKFLLHEYKKYYPLIKGDAFEIIQFRKRRILLVIFNLSPTAYCWFRRLVSKKTKRERT